jgi:outer membrane protein assembly factor BamB
VLLSCWSVLAETETVRWLLGAGGLMVECYLGQGTAAGLEWGLSPALRLWWYPREELFWELRAGLFDGLSLVLTLAGEPPNALEALMSLPGMTMPAPTVPAPAAEPALSSCQPAPQTLPGGGRLPASGSFFSEDQRTAQEGLWYGPQDQTRQALRRIWLRSNTPGAGTAAAFSPDGKLLALGAEDGLELWDADTGTNLGRLKGDQDIAYTLLTVRLLAFSPDGKMVAAGLESEVLLLDVPAWHERARLKAGSSYLSALAFSGDGKRLAISSHAGDKETTTQVWDLPARKQAFSFAGATGRVSCLAFSPNSRLLAAATLGSYDSAQPVAGRLHLCDMQTGKELPCPWGGSPEVLKLTVAFTPDGRHLAAGTAQRSLEIWSLKTGRNVRSLEADFVEHIAFSPDGRVLAIADDRGAKLWRWPTGKEMGVIRICDADTLTFTSDRRRLRLSTGGALLTEWEVPSR